MKRNLFDFSMDNDLIFTFERNTHGWEGIHVLINLLLSMAASEILYRIFPEILHKNK